MIPEMRKLNIVYVFADQWRYQATGYAGDPNVSTPHIDAMAASSVNFTQAVAGCPVCCPARASLITGQRPLTHGVFLNDVGLVDGFHGVSLAEAFAAAGYDTAYIGKWHLDGKGRSAYIPPERRLGFDYWKVLECTHNYLESRYYAGDDQTLRSWDDYDAFAQTEDAISYLQTHGSDKPFLLMLSWGPPHNPYELVPEDYLARYPADELKLRPNVPDDWAGKAREMLRGYYAHCTALDDCVGRLMKALEESGRAQDTIFVFTSDHGDMLGSHGQREKQRPWDESVRVPFLLQHPDGFQGERQAPLNTEDIMPTLLGLCDIDIPESVEGVNYANTIQGGDDPGDGCALITCPHPFGNWNRRDHGGREYRGLRTSRYTYVRDLQGPWLLYDNEADPYQLTNRVNDPELAGIQKELDAKLQHKLKAQGDAFLPGNEYVGQWGHTVDETGTVPYTW